MTAAEGVAEFAARIGPRSEPVDYLTHAFDVLNAMGWLRSHPSAFPVFRSVKREERATDDALYGSDGQGLDRADAWPHVTLWCLRLNRFLHPVDGLDQALYDWRIRVEDAAGERFHWLPCFPEHAP